MSHARRPYLLLVVIGLVIAALIAVVLWFKPTSSNRQSENMQTTTTDSEILNDSSSAVVAENVADNGNTRFVTGLENLPRSLQGTDVDGEIIIDENRQLVVTEGLRRLFDYFLSALGEEDEATIHARVESYIRSVTPEPAASQAIGLYHQYVAYLKAIPEIQKRYGTLQLQATQNGELDLNMVMQQKQDVARLRQQYFDDQTIQAFFGSEDEYDDYNIEMMRIEQNSQLSTAQKQAAQEDYVSRLPDGAIKTNIEQQVNMAKLMQRSKQMKARGATPEELYNMRRELVGAPAATRLAKLDAEDADFDQRFTQYQVQKQQLLTQNPDNVQTQINQLEQQLFSETERKRLTGYAALKQETSQ